MKVVLNVELTLTGSQHAALKRFLSHVRYGDVYKHVEHWGDGNKAGSTSDLETNETLNALMALKAALG